MECDNLRYKREIAWWFAELGREDEVELYISIFPELNSHLAKFAVGILLWDMTNKIDINQPDDVKLVSQILHTIVESGMFDYFDNTFNELNPNEVLDVICK